MVHKNRSWEVFRNKHGNPVRMEGLLGDSC